MNENGMSGSVGDGDGRQNTGGYDFGGYVPGEDYMPKRRSRRAPFYALVGVVTVIALVIAAVILL
ncbi:hypothetical protein I6E29_02365 [Arcanobacterium haemolyticum]|nr:hypothetical protein [Arcanobacterium haemolyticum]